MNTNSVGWCIEVLDLAASKLIAFREKDTEFVRLLFEEMISSKTLFDRLNKIEVEPELLDRAGIWVKRIAAELKSNELKIELRLLNRFRIGNLVRFFF